MLGKQAKTLSEQQIRGVLSALERGRNALRSRVMVLLSLHGLRAKEIALLEISMVTDSEGAIADSISLQDKASKGSSGRVVPMNKLLKEALRDYLAEHHRHRTKYVICTERSECFSANAVAVWFHRLYQSLGYEGASSHSGRRTFLTNCARNISRVGGSIADVMKLAGHKNLATTQRYVEQDPEAQKALIKLLYGSI